MLQGVHLYQVALRSRVLDLKVASAPAASLSAQVFAGVTEGALAASPAPPDVAGMLHTLSKQMTAISSRLDEVCLTVETLKLDADMEESD